MGFGSRLPTSNEQSDEWVYGPKEPYDDFSALLNGLAKRCSECKRVTMLSYLHKGRCPYCGLGHSVEQIGIE